MPPTFLHAHVEQEFLAAIEAAGLPAPDNIEHWDASVAFYWDGPKVVVVVDLDSGGDFGPEDFEELGLTQVRLH
jgi:hypothetical protein